MKILVAVLLVCVMMISKMQCYEKCGKNEYYTTCGACDGTCAKPEVPCPRICHPPGCYCVLDSVRGPDGNCIPLGECP
uniref:Cysteine-rich venom protein n=1 Tax=Pandinus cavimanus TaxID=217261 RepID=H2CYR6_PANCV|nr:cysteine-rich venom protein [Pandinus cavimanus]